METSTPKRTNTFSTTSKELLVLRGGGLKDKKRQSDILILNKGVLHKESTNEMAIIIFNEILRRILRKYIASATSNYRCKRIIIERIFSTIETANIGQLAATHHLGLTLTMDIAEKLTVNAVKEVCHISITRRIAKSIFYKHIKALLVGILVEVCKAKNIVTLTEQKTLSNKVENNLLAQEVFHGYLEGVIKKDVRTLYLLITVFDDLLTTVMYSELREENIGINVKRVKDELLEQIADNLLNKRLITLTRNLVMKTVISIRIYEKLKKTITKNTVSSVIKANENNKLLAKDILNSVIRNLMYKNIKNYIDVTIVIANDIYSDTLANTLILSIMEISKRTALSYSIASSIFPEQSVKVIRKFIKRIINNYMVAEKVWESFAEKKCKSMVIKCNLSHVISADIINACTKKFCLDTFSKKYISYMIYEQLLKFSFVNLFSINDLPKKPLAIQTSKVVVDNLMSRVLKEMIATIITELHPNKKYKMEIADRVIDAMLRQAVRSLVVSRAVKNAIINNGMSNALLQGLIRIHIYNIAKYCLNSTIYTSVISKAIYSKIYKQLVINTLTEDINKGPLVLAEEIFNQLIKKLIINEYKLNIKRWLANEILDGMLSKALDSMIYKKNTASKQLSASIYNGLQIKVIFKLSYLCLQSQTTTQVVFDSFLHSSIKTHTQKFAKTFLEIPSVISNITERYINSWTEQVMRTIISNQFVVASIADSMIDSLSLDEYKNNMNVEIDLDEAPQVNANTTIKPIPSFFPATKVAHNTKSKESSFTPSTNQTMRNVSEQLPSLDSILFSDEPAQRENIRSFDKVNQDFLLILKRIENSGEETEYNKLREIVMKALETDLSSSALEKLEAEPEKLLKEVKDEALVELCESIILLIREKAAILENEKHNEKTVDSEFPK